MVEVQSTPAVCLMPPAKNDGVAELDRSLTSTMTIGSVVRARRIGSIWTRYSSAPSVLVVDCLRVIQNILDYLMFCQ